MIPGEFVGQRGRQERPQYGTARNNDITMMSHMRLDTTQLLPHGSGESTDSQEKKEHAQYQVDIFLGKELRGT